MEKRTNTVADMISRLLLILAAIAYLGAFVCFIRRDMEEDTVHPQKLADLSEAEQQKLEGIIDQITDPDMNRIEKIKAVHDWMVRHIRYDLTYKQHDASDTLENGIAVCSGYSALFFDFMKIMDIPCVKQAGPVIDSKKVDSRHAWNAVQLEDGVWYFIDVCWDDPIYKGSSDYKDGSNMEYTYFLCGRSTIEKERIPDQLPEGSISDTDYAWKDHISESHWIRSGSKWMYRQEGLWLKHQWLQYKDKWYYLDSDGFMVTGWQWIRGQYYYFWPDGAMAADETLYFDNIPYSFDHDGNYKKLK